jgi:hypothetical protein
LLLKPRGVWIHNAWIVGELDLKGQEIDYDIHLVECHFEDGINLTGSHFSRGLDLSDSTFHKYRTVDFSDAAVDRDFVVEGCKFLQVPLLISFRGIRVGQDFRIRAATFNTVTVSFVRARVGGTFSGEGSTFTTVSVQFDEMRVDGFFSARGCKFSYDDDSAELMALAGVSPGAKVSFKGAHFADVFLDDSTFDSVSTIDFTRMQADFISFDRVKFSTPSEIILERMTFKLLSPVNAERLQFLLSHYNAEFYTDLETSFRTHGYPDEADKIFIAKKRAERRNYRAWAWAWSVFQDLLIGYGKSLQNLLYWSLGFLLIGIFVFRSEQGMRTKDPKDAENYEGKYHAFWYTLDLFLPVIKLGEADVWTPKDDRRWANLYRKVHIIIGSLFVPIGLAAWTGIIK